MIKERLIKTLSMVLFIAGIVYASYGVSRDKFFLLISSVTLSFVSLIPLWKKLSWQEIFGLGLLVRVVLIIHFPNLSDDLFRFLWDGNLTAEGINVFSNTPRGLVEQNSGFLNSDYLQLLYDNMNSPDYHTVYPPLNQLIFYISNVVSGENVMVGAIVIRCFILLAEMLTIVGLKSLFDHFGIDKKYSLLYVLNPLVILELTGNLHFEAFMIVGLVWMLNFLVKQNLWGAAICMAVAINAKLLPLMFLPVFIRFLAWKELRLFYSIIISLTLLSFLPFISEVFLLNHSSSLDLYFQKFEFNAGLFYLIREIGFVLKGYDVIQTVGPILTIISLLTILWISWKNKVNSIEELIQKFFWIFLIFLCFSMTVHPWYLSLLILFNVFKPYRFVIAWSLLIYLTYFTYKTTSYEENLFLVLVEYLVIFTLHIQEYISNRSKKVSLE